MESVNLQVECFGTVNVKKKKYKKVVQDIFGLCLREKMLDNATVLFGSKAPLSYCYGCDMKAVEKFKLVRFLLLKCHPMKREDARNASFTA